MKKKLFILAVALFMFMPFVKVQAAPPDNGYFGNKDECYYRFNSTTGAFVIERAPNNNICRLEIGSSVVWNSFAKDIKSFEIKQGVKAPNSMDQYFWKLTNVEEIDVNELDVSSTTSMNQVFTDVGSNATNPIAELDLSKWNTSKVTEMDSMFLYSNIKSLKLGKGFDTSNVEYFGAMFAESKFEELILNFDTSKLNSFTVMSMFQDATHLKKLDISSFDMTKARSYDGMFMNVGKDAKEGTEIILNSTFGGLAPSEFADYEFPYDFYTINGGETYQLSSLRNQIAQTTGKASLIPVFPFQIHDGSGISYNKYNHRTGTKIDTSKIKNITPKDGFRLVKWTDTPDPKIATIEIPAGEQSTSTYADFYNTQNALTAGITLYAQWEEIKYIAKFDLNGGSGKNGFTTMDIDIPADFESLIPTWDELKDFIEAPFGKIYVGVEINGKKVNPGVNYKPTGDVTIKLLWEDKYKILEGANQTYTIDSNVDVVIKASGDKDKLSMILVDGAILDTANYITDNGSTILTLKASYLNTLSVGDHTIQFAYDDGSVSTNLKVVKNSSTGGNTGGNTESSNPQTSDNIIYYILVLGLSIIGMASGIVYINKKKLFNR